MLTGNWYIKFSRYLLGKQFLPVMRGYLKGYLWTTKRNYEYITGNYEDPHTLKQLVNWCKKDAVFYDIGANVGYHSFVANLFVTEGVIYSFEPLPFNIALFNRHLVLNKNKLKADNIRLLTFGITDETKELEFSGNEAAADGNTYIAASSVYRQSVNRISIQCFSIDELQEKAYEPPTIIKIDVEGAEYDVLKGAVHTIKKYRPNILLATHDCNLPGVRDKCINFLKELGYTVEPQSRHNMHMQGLEDFIAIHADKIQSLKL